MSSRADRLQPAVDQANKRREDAMQKLAEQQQRLAKAELQLSELQRYRARLRGRGGAGRGVSVTALLNRQQFVERIDQAIAQQELEIKRLRRQLDQARGHWREAHAREKALDSVVDRLSRAGAQGRRPPRAGGDRRAHAVPPAEVGRAHDPDPTIGANLAA